MENSRNDIDIVSDIKAGDKAAFDELMTKYGRYVHFVAMGFLGPKQQEVDDVIQMVFINIWKGRNNLRTDLSFRNYLHTITANICKNHLEKIKTYDRYISDYSDNANTIQSPYVKEPYLVGRIHEAIQGIKNKSTQLVVTMILMDEKTYPEIMQETGIPPKAARNHYSRGMAILRNRLKKSL